MEIDYKKLVIVNHSINGILSNDNDIFKKSSTVKDYKKISILYKDFEKNFDTLKVRNEINKEKLLKIFNFDVSIYNKNIYEFSSGEKKEIAILKVLSDNPDLIVLDDPFSNLDYKIKIKLVNILKKLKNDYNKTIIIKSSNIKDLYFVCDNISVFNKSKMLYNVEKKDFINKFKDFEPIEFSEYLLKEKNRKIGYYDNVKDLIKAVYRDVGY